MHRRELIQLIAAVTGCAFVGSDALWAAGDPSLALPYTPADIDFLDEVAETILPRTDTPGARDAAVGPFIARYSAACYVPEDIERVKFGISDIDARMRARGAVGFRQASEAAKNALLAQIDREARAVNATPGDPPRHYFTLMKQLTLFGFFTSEPGATRVARYRPVPGEYKGCIPYVKGETFWAW